MEPPKEEQKNAEQNGPVDGQGDNPGPQAAEQGTDTAVPLDSDKKLPEMDIDWFQQLFILKLTKKSPVFNCSSWYLEQSWQLKAL